METWQRILPMGAMEASTAASTANSTQTERYEVDGELIEAGITLPVGVADDGDDYPSDGGSEDSPEERDDEAFGNDLAQETGETGSKGGAETLISDMRAETRAIWRLAALAQAMRRRTATPPRRAKRLPRRSWVISRE